MSSAGAGERSTADWRAASADRAGADERELSAYLSRPMTPPEPAVMEAIARGPIEPGQALALSEVGRLLDPRPMAVETGWCTLPDGVGFVAVRTAMPLLSGEMVDWWFDWHPRVPLRYRVWHPAAHRSNSLDAPAQGPARVGAGAKAHWGAVHHPVEDIGIGVVHARIAFQRPSEMGLTGDQLENPDVASIVCGYVGDDRRHVRHTPMFHVFLRDGAGVVLRSAFWLGAAVRPYGPLGPAGERVMNNRLTRRATLPAGLPRALATHCAEEYANLATLLPELFERFA
ncbi:MAG: DAPG hydrolase family protein [Solirubrobacterales bacterium]